MESVMFEIDSPPSALALGEHPAVIEPALRDLPDFVGIEVGAAENVEIAEGDEREWEGLREAAERVARADERTADFLVQRHQVIGISRLRSRRGAEQLLLVVYGYEHGQTCEVTMELGKGEPMVTEVAFLDYQPAPADEEIEAALRIARSHRLVRDRLDEDYEGYALLASAVEPGDEHYGHRRMSVVFGLPDERLPRVHALVDLATERVLWVRSEQVAR
jgi:hypothetical protein